MCYDACNVSRGNNKSKLKKKEFRNIVFQIANHPNILFLRSLDERKRLKQGLLLILNNILPMC